ncbi:hypothetical protein P376_5937 [Streptomyces sp. HCCB10043]|nr:hypothetical protein P376_5937 [Streptomyces sp. HCCB10043]
MCTHVSTVLRRSRTGERERTTPYRTLVLGLLTSGGASATMDG